MILYCSLDTSEVGNGWLKPTAQPSSLWPLPTNSSLSIDLLVPGTCRLSFFVSFCVDLSHPVSSPRLRLSLPALLAHFGGGLSSLDDTVSSQRLRHPPPGCTCCRACRSRDASDLAPPRGFAYLTRIAFTKRKRCECSIWRVA